MNAPEVFTCKQSLFIEYFLKEPQTFGAATRAARKAGYGTATSSPESMATLSSRLMRTPKIAAAIRLGVFRGSSPTCAICASSFAARGMQKYCSPECSRQAQRNRRPVKSCGFCLQPFQGPGPKYCSEDHRAEASKIRAKIKHKRSYSPRGNWQKYSSESWINKAKAAIRALEDLGIEI